MCEIEKLKKLIHLGYGNKVSTDSTSKDVFLQKVILRDLEELSKKQKKQKEDKSVEELINNIFQGKEVSLAHLNLDFFENNGRPIRLSRN